VSLDGRRNPEDGTVWAVTVKEALVKLLGTHADKRRRRRSNYL
jgi:hypothetical protein